MKRDDSIIGVFIFCALCTGFFTAICAIGYPSASILSESIADDEIPTLE